MNVLPYNPHRAPETFAPAPHWSTDAACKEVNPDFMYPAAQDRDHINAARALCTQCPVRTECLDDAMRAEGSRTKDSRYGIRAGLTGSQRYLKYNRERQAAKAAA